MSTPAPKPDAFDKLLDTYVEELLSMSDEEALGGADPATMKNEGMALLQKAREQAGRRRLETARAKLAEEKMNVPTAATPGSISAQEARAFLLRAANDGRYTLVARELTNMSDEEALRMYAQIKKLEGLQGSSGGDR
jgi:hypothetical protein